jgi:hypothetical protein
MVEDLRGSHGCASFGIANPSRKRLPKLTCQMSAEKENRIMFLWVCVVIWSLGEGIAIVFGNHGLEASPIGQVVCLVTATKLKRSPVGVKRWVGALICFVSPSPSRFEFPVREILKEKKKKKEKKERKKNSSCNFGLYVRWRESMPPFWKHPR